MSVPQRPAPLRDLGPVYVPVQPWELTCTCTTYAGTQVTCIKCSIDRHFFNPYPTLSAHTGPVIRRKNFTVPNPLQGKLA